MTPVHGSTAIIKFAEDTSVVGLISDEDEPSYREEVQLLTTWCTDNNLTLNLTQTKELIVDYIFDTSILVKKVQRCI